MVEVLVDDVRGPVWGEAVVVGEHVGAEFGELEPGAGFEVAGRGLEGCVGKDGLWGGPHDFREQVGEFLDAVCDVARVDEVEGVFFVGPFELEVVYFEAAVWGHPDSSDEIYISINNRESYN